MRQVVAIILILTFSGSLQSQGVLGSWHGVLKVPGMELKVVFNISADGDELKATMDSPTQGAMGIPVTSVAFNNGSLSLEIPKAIIAYKGELKGDVIEGTFTQRGQGFPLLLQRGEGSGALHRPQVPKAPFPYVVEDVRFVSQKAKITLAGTLTLPNIDGDYPVAILVSGSGPQNRDSEVFGHKPFWVIADYLARQGIGTLRFDDRGVGQSEGVFAEATTFHFADDVESALSYLASRKDLKSSKFGLIGHSEGGIIAPIVASRSSSVAFVVLLAGSGLRGDELLLLQKKLIEAQMGVPLPSIGYGQQLMRGAYNIITSSEGDFSVINAKVDEYFNGVLGENASNNQIVGLKKQLSSPWMIEFIRLDPTTYLKGVTCPVLVLNGEKDLQVPPKENLTAIREALQAGGNIKVEVKEFAGLNHLFQECQTGAVGEYATIEQTFSPQVMELMANWINQSNNKNE